MLNVKEGTIVTITQMFDIVEDYFKQNDYIISLKPKPLQRVHLKESWEDSELLGDLYEGSILLLPNIVMSYVDESNYKITLL